ncbi:hypothetical protein TNCV_134621 [Trichonephila clavipes]|nr:hypothetical protein TNCV_134621 [Trichonephila clavipes]
MLLLSCVSSWDTYEKKRDRRTEKHSTITEEYGLYYTNGDPSIEQKGCAAFYSRRESISGEIPTSFPENTSMPYLGFEPMPTLLQAECHNHHTG